VVQISVSLAVTSPDAVGKTRCVALLLLLFLAVVACDRGRAPADAGSFPEASAARPAWPALPINAEEASRIVEQATRRPPGHRVSGDVDPSRVVWAALDRTGEHALVAGLDAIDAWIAARVSAAAKQNRSAFVIFGAKHDAAGPIAVFRRLVGASSRAGWTRLLVEQFQATGRWTGIDAATQRGEDDALTRFYATGASDAFAELRASQEEHDYAAWKLGYLDEVMDLLHTSRAASRPIVPCDMPSTLARRLSLSEELTLRVREVHCMRALEDALVLAHPPSVDRSAASPETRRPHRIAALWGEAHVSAEGFPRFLPPDAEIVVVRIAPAPAFDIVDPVLVPPRSPEEDALLVLADPAAAKYVDRVRTKTRSDGGGSATFTAMEFRNMKKAPIEVRLDGKPMSIGAEQTNTTLSVGSHVLVVPRESRRVIMALPMPAGANVTVSVSRVPESFTVTFTYDAVAQ
jgi:hypothetical protein